MPRAMKWAMSLLLGLAVVFAGWKWAPWLLSTFFVLNCLVLVMVVLLQSGKAADLAGAFGGAGSQTAFGPRGAATVLSRATTWCAIMFMVCSMALVLRQDRVSTRGSSVLEKFSKPATKPAPQAPATQAQPQSPASQPAPEQPKQP